MKLKMILTRRLKMVTMDNIDTVIQCDDLTKKKINYILKKGDLEKNTYNVYVLRELIADCYNNNLTIDIDRSKVQYTGSPLPNNYFVWTVCDKSKKNIANFNISRNVIPRSVKTNKAEEFKNFQLKIRNYCFDVKR